MRNKQNLGTLLSNQDVTAFDLTPPPIERRVSGGKTKDLYTFSAINNTREELKKGYIASVRYTKEGEGLPTLEVPYKYSGNIAVVVSGALHEGIAKVTYNPTAEFFIDDIGGWPYSSYKYITASPTGSVIPLHDDVYAPNYNAPDFLYKINGPTSVPYDATEAPQYFTGYQVDSFKNFNPFAITIVRDDADVPIKVIISAYGDIENPIAGTVFAGDKYITVDAEEFEYPTTYNKFYYVVVTADAETEELTASIVDSVSSYDYRYSWWTVIGEVVSDTQGLTQNLTTNPIIEGRVF